MLHSNFTPDISNSWFLEPTGKSGFYCMLLVNISCIWSMENSDKVHLLVWQIIQESRVKSDHATKPKATTITYILSVSKSDNKHGLFWYQTWPVLFFDQHLFIFVQQMLLGSIRKGLPNIHILYDCIMFSRMLDHWKFSRMLGNVECWIMLKVCSTFVQLFINTRGLLNECWSKVTTVHTCQPHLSVDRWYASCLLGWLPFYHACFI